MWNLLSWHDFISIYHYFKKIIIIKIWQSLLGEWHFTETLRSYVIS